MSVSEINSQIELAFKDTPHPGLGFSDISVTQWDEGIVDYFRRTTWHGHDVNKLREHSAALSFFTHKAFRYWLPAFMLAELDHPEKADVISESIAFSLTKSSNPAERVATFNRLELQAILSFLEECARRYKPPCTRIFKGAAAAVQKNIEESAGM